MTIDESASASPTARPSSAGAHGASLGALATLRRCAVLAGAHRAIVTAATRGLCARSRRRSLHADRPRSDASRVLQRSTSRGVGADDRIAERGRRGRRLRDRRLPPRPRGRGVPGYDFVDEDADASDPPGSGHGTAVTGVAAARANNGIGGVGACFACTGHAAPRARPGRHRVQHEHVRGDRLRRRPRGGRREREPVRRALAEAAARSGRPGTRGRRARRRGGRQRGERDAAVSRRLPRSDLGRLRDLRPGRSRASPAAAPG